MRIGIFTHNYPAKPGDRKDAGIFVYDFAHTLSKSNSVFVFCPKVNAGGNEDREVPVTWFTWSMSPGKLGFWKIFSLKSIWYFIRFIVGGSRAAVKFSAENKIEYSLAAWSLPSGIFAYWVKRKLGVPYAVWNLGSDINKYARIPVLRGLIKLSLRNADAVYANSYSLVRKVEELTSRPCNFLPAVTDIGDKLLWHEHRKTKEGPTSFLFVGRLEKVKGLDILIEACHQLKLAGEKFTLDILGEGSQLQEMQNIVAASGLTPEVKFQGWADNTMVVRFMQKADVLVIPSRSESLPLVLLEAARFSLPVIAAGVGDCPELIKKYHLGLSFKTGDPQALVQAMRRLIDDKETFKGDYKKVCEDYSQEVAVSNFLKSAKLTIDRK